MSTFREDEIICKSLVIEGVCSLSASRGTSGESDRLSLQFFNGAAEVEIIPSDTFDKVSRIISQLQLMGRLRETNGVRWRKRAAISIFNDSAGGEAMYIDSSVTGDSPVGERGMPMVYRMSGHGEVPLIDIVFHPSDSSLELKSYEYPVDGMEPIVTAERKTIKAWMGK